MYNLAKKEIEFEMTFELDSPKIKKAILSDQACRVKMVNKLSQVIADAFLEFCRDKGIAYKTKADCAFIMGNKENEIKFHISVKQHRNIANWLLVAFWIPSLFLSEVELRKNILLEPVINFGLFLEKKSLSIDENLGHT
ncbi:hypothetical protein [Galenea microaerophila]